MINSFTDQILNGNGNGNVESEVKFEIESFGPMQLLFLPEQSLDEYIFENEIIAFLLSDSVWNDCVFCVGILSFEAIILCAHHQHCYGRHALEFVHYLWNCND